MNHASQDRDFEIFYYIENIYTSNRKTFSFNFVSQFLRKKCIFFFFDKIRRNNRFDFETLSLKTKYWESIFNGVGIEQSMRYIVDENGTTSLVARLKPLLGQLLLDPDSN